MTGNGWAVTNQDIIYPLSLLYLTEGSRYYQDDTILDLVIRGGDALRDFQNPDGTVEFIKPDGSTWGAIYMPWSMFHWLETYRLVADLLDPARRDRWAEGLELAYAGITGKLDEQDVHNIPTWNGAASYRAGTIFGRTEWTRAGERMIARAVEGQHRSGYWPEHFGPTSSYNYVYVHALGLYHVFSGDTSVLDALERATEFHIRYTYPDGRVIETIDGRVKYHDRIPTAGHVGLQFTPRGRRYVEFLVDRLLDQRASSQPGTDEDIVKSGSIKTSSTVLGLESRIAATFEHWRPGFGEPIPQDTGSYRCLDSGFSAITRSGSWLTCVSECTTPPVESRWGQDRQNMLSIWNEKHGLIVGGGNSKDQPKWSSFVVGVGENIVYIPDDAKSAADASGDRCTYTIGGETINVVTEIDDADVVRLHWTGPASATVQLLLRFHEGMKVETADDITELRLDDAIEWNLDSNGSWIIFAGIRIEVGGAGVLSWPVSPFNPYTKDGSSPGADSTAVLALSLGTGDASIALHTN